MAEIATIGLDLAKSWFQVRGADAQGRPVLRKKLARGKVIPPQHVKPCVKRNRSYAGGRRLLPV